MKAMGSHPRTKLITHIHNMWRGVTESSQILQGSLQIPQGSPKLPVCLLTESSRKQLGELHFIMECSCHGALSGIAHRGREARPLITACQASSDRVQQTKELERGNLMQESCCRGR